MLTLPILKTARLHIRPFAAGDLESIHRILDIELAAADFGTDGPSTLPERETWLRWSILNYQQLARLYQPPYGDRAVVLESTGELIGACGFVPCLGPFAQLAQAAGSSPPERAAFNPEIGLYYAISPAFQRRGYAGEAAAAFVTYAFDHFDLERVVATTTYDNAASIRVMEKIGMRILRNPRPEPEWFQIVGVIQRRARD